MNTFVKPGKNEFFFSENERIGNSCRDGIEKKTLDLSLDLR